MLAIIYFQLYEASTTFQSMTYVINDDSADSIPGEPIVFAEEDPTTGARIKCIVNRDSILTAMKVEPNVEASFDSADQRLARAVLKSPIDDRLLNTTQLLPLIILRLFCEHAMIHLIQMIHGGVLASTQSLFNHNPAATFLGHAGSADLNQMLSSQINFTLIQEERRSAQLIQLSINK
jgi:hypothetical protein